MAVKFTKNKTVIPGVLLPFYEQYKKRPLELIDHLDEVLNAWDASNWTHEWQLLEGLLTGRATGESDSVVRQALAELLTDADEEFLKSMVLDATVNHCGDDWEDMTPESVIQGIIMHLEKHG